MKSETRTEESGKQLDLSLLAKGLGVITEAYGASIAEAAAVCLDDQGHEKTVRLAVSGSVRTAYAVCWNDSTEQARRCWNDEPYATEHGAYAVGILIARDITGLNVVDRSCKGTGFDFWLGEDSSELPFQNKARLEVSGIRKKNDSAFRARSSQKQEQTKASDSSSLDAYVIVVEFGTPRSHVVKRWMT